MCRVLMKEEGKNSQSITDAEWGTTAYVSASDRDGMQVQHAITEEVESA